MKSRLSIRLALLALVAVAGLQVAGKMDLGQGTWADSLQYRVLVHPGGAFDVELRVRGCRGPLPRFRLLDGWGLLQDQTSHIHDLTARNDDGTELPVTRQMNDGEATWTVGGSPSKKEFRLAYRVEPYDAYLSPEASFADAERTVLVGYSLFLIPDQLGGRGSAPLHVRVDLPEGWPVWSSWPPDGDGFRPASLHDLWSGMVAGGKYTASRMETGRVSVTALTEHPDGMGLRISNRLLPVLREMSALFGAPPRGDSLSVVALYRTMPIRNRMSQMIGNSEEGAFLCLATPDRFRDADDLTVLATHECLHFYLGGAVTATSEPPFRNAPDLVWFTEGVTEFLTFRLMERAGVLTPRAVREVVAAKEREYHDTPGAAAYSLADAARRMEDNAVYGLVYSRGYLAARLLERRMDATCGEGTFEGVLRRLFETHNFYRDGKTISARDVRAAFEGACPGTGDLIDRYAVGREPIPPTGVTAGARSPRVGPAVR